MNKIPGVYCIENTVNGMKYIGSTIDLKKRLSGHRTLLRGAKHTNPYLQNSYNKYGEQNFRFYVIAEFSENENIIDAEDLLIEMLATRIPNGFNIRECAESNAGCKVHPDVIEKRASKIRGKKLSPERCRQIGDIHRGMKHTEATKKLISEKKKGVKITFSNPEERSKKISAAHIGKTVKPETRLKLSLLNYGKSTISDAKKEQVSQLFSDGKTRQEIAEIVGIHRHTVGHLISGRVK